jgi:hypothetical protein
MVDLIGLGEDRTESLSVKGSELIRWKAIAGESAEAQ